MTNVIAASLSFALGLTFVCFFVAWIWSHIWFWRSLAAECPDLARDLNGIQGLQLKWVDFALRRGYRDVGGPRLQRAGDFLVNFYSWYTAICAVLMFVAATAAGFAWLWAVE